MINGVVYKIRTGVSWHDLPERYGPWKTVYTRFRRYAIGETPDGRTGRSRPRPIPRRPDHQNPPRQGPAAAGPWPSC
ncbi:transposase [Streptomyces rishiriensis]|uniref:Transposase n=1 Tax=Streptomyces rishiriensis TaxID=68264 RepID=A0ABU0NHH6_STRRH|nr:transposase [Streptomyces rishiriensis]